MQTDIEVHVPHNLIFDRILIFINDPEYCRHNLTVDDTTRL